MSIKIQLDEHTVEDYKSIKMMKELGFTDEEIQVLYDKQKESDARKMKTWYIWGLYLPVLLIEANTFDEALEEARRINPNYNIGKLREGMKLLTIVLIAILINVCISD